MIITSYEFICAFLPASLIIFFAFSKLSRNAAICALVVSSLLFYCVSGMKYFPALLISVCVNYFVCMKIESSAKKSWLISGVMFNILLLGYFKYAGNLPPGISFWTFSQIACLAEIYRSSIRLGGFTEYSAFAVFFPYMISGPVVNPRDILPQLRNESLYRPDYENIAKGITLFAIGLFKKVCFADMIASSVNANFVVYGGIKFSDAWLAALGYGMQLYFDFSGYSDMAVGIGLMFGLKLPANFESPYKSLSIIDFWRRWHMSLGAWIRDYIYIPLGGSRQGEMTRTRNVILAMLFTGLWHGLGWTFVVWGLAHGLMLAVNHTWRKFGFRLPALVSWGITFMCVIICWVIFRAESLNDAMTIIRAMMDFGNFALPNHDEKITSLLLFAALFMPNSRQILERFRPNIIWLVAAFGVVVISFVNLSGVSDFLYFQF